MFNISNLPPPQAIEELDYEKILIDRKTRFLELLTAEQNQIFSERLNYESEPILKLLQESAYLELLLRQKINNNYKAVLLAFAQSTDLDALAINYGVIRKVLEPANAKTTPPTPAIFESDEDLRQRCFLSYESLTNAGTIGAYKYHTLNADIKVKDCFITSPQPCDIEIFLLSHDGDGAAPAALCTKVKNYLNQEDKRPIGDRITVKTCQIVNINLALTIYIVDPIYKDNIKTLAEANIKQLFKSLKLGYDLNHASVIQACNLEGVHNIKVTTPTTDYTINNNQIARLNSLNINIEIKER